MDTNRLDDEEWIYRADAAVLAGCDERTLQRWHNDHTTPVAGMLAVVPTLTVLVTSRSALRSRVRGEVELTVHPLALHADGMVAMPAVEASRPPHCC